MPHLTYWESAWLILVIAALIAFYGYREGRQEEGSPWVYVSAYIASISLSIVTFLYVAILPVEWIIRHTHWGSMDMLNFVILCVLSLGLTWISGLSIRRGVEEL